MAEEDSRIPPTEEVDDPLSPDGVEPPPSETPEPRPHPAAPSRRGQILLEYVTFGYGAHHLLKAVVLQFVILFLDAGLFEYTTQTGAFAEQWVVAVVWLLASLVFCCILVVLVRRIGRRTLAPRFHRPRHVVGSVAGYLMASGLSFAFGYLTFVYPRRSVEGLSVPDLLPGTLLVLVFATFVAIGYHEQVDVTDHPTPTAIRETIDAWLDALSWIERDTDSLARENAYEEFTARTDRLATLLSHAHTVEGRELAADFQQWRQQFETHSMLSKELIVEGRAADDAPESERLAAEHERLRQLRARLVVVAESTDRQS